MGTISGTKLSIHSFFKFQRHWSFVKTSMSSLHFKDFNSKTLMSFVKTSMSSLHFKDFNVFFTIQDFNVFCQDLNVFFTFQDFNVFCQDFNVFFTFQTLQCLMSRLQCLLCISQTSISFV